MYFDVRAEGGVDERSRMNPATLAPARKCRCDLLPPEMDSQLIRTQFLSEDFLSRSHVAAKFAGTLKFFFGDSLTWDDVLNRHGGIVMQNGKTPLTSSRTGRS